MKDAENNKYSEYKIQKNNTECTTYRNYTTHKIQL